jgi:hypothetical protein
MRDFLINLAAGVVLFVLVPFAGWFIVVARRRRLLRFFGVLKKRRILLYWSHLRIVIGGALGVDDAPRSYSGSAAPFGEATVLPIYRRLFTAIVPGLDDPSGLLRRVILSDVELVAQVAPTTTDGTDFSSSLISLGSPGYNGASAWIETTLHPVARFIQDNGAIEVQGNPPYTSDLHAFLQRIRIGDGPRVAFYAAGMSAGSTVTAAFFLASRWSYLYRRFGDRENFCLVLEVVPANPTSPKILLERGEE